MRIGIPSETKTLEGRVALVPAACADLVRRGHEVYLQSGAGQKSCFKDEEYTRVGVHVVADAAALYAAAELIVKVKEPIAGDLALLQKQHLLFCYLHLAPEPELTRHLLAIGLTGVAFESVEEADGGLPLLAPMSIIAGRIAVQIGTHLLHQPAGGANVVVFDKRPDRLAQMMALGSNVTALYPYEEYVAREVRDADLVIGAVLIPSAKAPHVVTRAMVTSMEKGSVMVDISIDQGGCFETSKPTTYADPTYIVDGVTHFAVTNMPGAVPQTSSQAISAAILPYVQRLAAGKSWREHEPLRRGINVEAGAIVHPALKGLV